MRKYIVLLYSLLFLGIADCISQKKPLDMEAYKLWRRVEGQQMSEDGKWVTYRFVYIDQEGHDKDVPVTYLRDMTSGKVYEFPNVREMSFFNQGKGLRYVVQPSPLDTLKERKDSLFLLSLKDMKKTYWDKPYGFRESPHSPLISYSYPIDRDGKNRALRRLIVWNFETGDSVRIDSVKNYFSTDDYKSVVYIRNHNGKKSLRVGLVKGKHQVIYDDEKAIVTNFSLNRGGLKGVFSVASDSSYLREPDLLYTFSVVDGKYRLVMDTKEVVVSDEYKVRGGIYSVFNNGKYIFVDVGLQQQEERKPKAKPDKSFELELWKWDDEVSQSRQSYGLGGDRRKMPKYVYHVDSKKCVLVAPSHIDQMYQPSCDEYRYVIIADETPYRGLADWRDEVTADLYLVSLETGERTLLFKDFRQRPVWSPNGKYAMLYHAEKKVWYKLNPETGELTDVSTPIGFAVYNEEHDLPKPAVPYGIAGWLAGGDQVVLYDKYDMWVVDLTGKQPTYSLTNGWGREHGISLRLLKANREMRWINPKQNILVHGLDRETLDQGVYVLTPNRKVKKLMSGAYDLYFNQQSENGKFYLFTRQSYTEFRELWWSKNDFTRPVRITNTNPQQENYLWGSVQLVEWTNFEGKPNRGLLYLPENYDLTKRYPVIVNFYETHTGDLHTYQLPSLSSAMINTVTYVSNGYVVFMPDVHFTVGAPGESCYNAVVSGTQMLIDRGIADKDRIGVQGHSWSGYQVAYLVTRTNMFKCASPGAAVSNMVSAYTGIRTGSGMPRMFMYEETQSRMGKTLWDDPEAYIKNSPIFYADKIQTPLLIFHCDGDEAVPYSEGLNLFLAMRRLHKPAWLLNYKGDRHFLYNKAAEIDWTIRLQQFFDYYLKDTPMPRWMKEGINVNERGVDQKYDFVK